MIIPIMMPMYGGGTIGPLTTGMIIALSCFGVSFLGLFLALGGMIFDVDVLVEGIGMPLAFIGLSLGTLVVIVSIIFNF